MTEEEPQFDLKPEEVVRHYEGAVSDKEKALKTDRSTVRRFLASIVQGRNRPYRHNRVMAAVPEAQSLAEHYSREHLPALQAQVKTEAEAEGKTIQIEQDPPKAA